MPLLCLELCVWLSGVLGGWFLGKQTKKPQQITTTTEKPNRNLVHQCSFLLSIFYIRAAILWLCYHLYWFFNIYRRKSCFQYFPPRREKHNHRMFLWGLFMLWYSRTNAMIEWKISFFFSWRSVGIPLFQALGWYPMVSQARCALSFRPSSAKRGYWVAFQVKNVPCSFSLSVEGIVFFAAETHINCDF